jgi:hypothetical protein
VRQPLGAGVPEDHELEPVGAGVAERP